MTERSLFWEGTVLGDAGPYTQSDLMDRFMRALLNGTGNRGVLFGWANALEITNSTGRTPVSVSTGAGVVYGMFYRRMAEAVSVAIPTPSAGYARYDLVVLRRSWSAQTVRIARVAGTAAVSPTVPALTQTVGTTYEVPLAQVYVDDAGTLTVTDTREYCAYSTYWRALADVGADDVADGAVTDDKIPDRTRTFIKDAGQIIDDSATPATWVAGVNYDYWEYADAATESTWCYFHFPATMVGTTMDVDVWSVPDVNGAGGGVENCQWDYEAYTFSSAGVMTSTTGTVNVDQQLRINTTVYQDALIAALPTDGANIVALKLDRDGVADSYNSPMRLLGIELSYTFNA